MKEICPIYEILTIDLATVSFTAHPKEVLPPFRMDNLCTKITEY